MGLFWPPFPLLGGLVAKGFLLSFFGSDPPLRAAWTLVGGSGICTRSAHTMLDVKDPSFVFLAAGGASPDRRRLFESARASAKGETGFVYISFLDKYQQALGCVPKFRL